MRTSDRIDRFLHDKESRERVRNVEKQIMAILHLHHPWAVAEPVLVRRVHATTDAEDETILAVLNRMQRITRSYDGTGYLRRAFWSLKETV